MFAQDISLNVYSASGVSLDTFSTVGPLTLNQAEGGVGGSGLVFALDETQAGQLQSLVNNNLGNEVFTLSATFDNASGGLDVLQVANIAAIQQPGP